MTLPSRIGVGLLLCLIVLATIAYGAVHQPILAFFYVSISLLLLLWAIDSLKSGTVKLSLSKLQIPLYAAAAYGALQTIPFGAIADMAGVSGIPRTISYDPFATQMSALHYLADELKRAFSFFISVFFQPAGSRHEMPWSLHAVSVPASAIDCCSGVNLAGSALLLSVFASLLLEEFDDGVSVPFVPEMDFNFSPMPQKVRRNVINASEMTDLI